MVRKAISLAGLLLLVMTVFASNSAFAAQLKDIKGHWAEGYITPLVEKGIISGNENGEFHPGNNITVAEFTKLVVKALGIEYDSGGPWYDGVIRAAKSAGIIKEGEFDNYDKRFITRAEMARMIARALGVSSHTGATGFLDDSQIPYEMKVYVNAATECQIINGMTGNYFKPDNKATRAEAAAMITRMLDYMYEHKNDLIQKESSNGIIPAMKDGKWGYVDESGEVLLDFQYDDIWGVYDDMYCVLEGYDIVYKCYSNGKDLTRTFASADMNTYLAETYDVDMSNILTAADVKSNYVIFRASCSKLIRQYEENLKQDDPAEFERYNFYRERAYELESAKNKAKIQEYNQLIDYWEEKQETWPDSFKYGD